MRIVSIADTHGLHKDLILPEGDILIFSGDMCSYGRSDEIKDFYKWLIKQPGKYKVIIGGNHDEPLTRTKNKAYFSDIYYLENDGIEIEGIKIWGSPITPRFGNWFFMKDRGVDIRKVWDLIPKDTDILITHGPAYGILDVAPYPKPESVGCFDLLNKIREIKPKLHIFGHIHDCYGTLKIGETTFINASVVNEDYELVNEPIIHDYN